MRPSRARSSWPGTGLRTATTPRSRSWSNRPSAPHSPPERAQIDARYAGYDWPFPALPAPSMWLEMEWSLAHFLRYLSSMSAVARCAADTGVDPVAHHAPALAAAWGDPDEARTIQWPLFLHLRRKP